MFCGNTHRELPIERSALAMRFRSVSSLLRQWGRCFPVISCLSFLFFFDDVVSVRLKRKSYNGGLCLRLGAVIFLNPGEGFIPSLRHHHETSPVSRRENLPSIESRGLRL